MARGQQLAKRQVNEETVTFARAEDVQVGDTLKRLDKDVEVVAIAKGEPTDGVTAVGMVLGTGEILVHRSHFRLPVVETEDA